MNKRILILCFLILLFSACKKDEVIPDVQTIQTTSSFDFHGIQFYNSKDGFVCGGSKYEKGIWLKTSDGGKSWCCEDSVYEKCAYGITFNNASQGVIYGFDGFIAETGNGGTTFDVRNIPDWLPVNKLIQLTGNRWVLAYGANYNLGGILTTTDGGNSWVKRNLNTDMQSVHTFNNRDIIACGYGHVLYSTDSGTTWNSSSIKGDFYTDVQFINATMAVSCGYQGSIIRTENKGEHWYTVKSGNHPFEQREHFEALHFFDEFNGIACGTEGCVYYSSDRGVTWQKMKPFTTDRLRDAWMLSAKSALIAGEKGKIFMLKWN